MIFFLQHPDMFGFNIAEIKKILQNRFVQFLRRLSPQAIVYGKVRHICTNPDVK